jgi:hypothetical protein
MAATDHPQGTIRGLIAKAEIYIGYTGGALEVTANSTGMVLSGGVQLNKKKYMNANSTGYLFTAGASKPSSRTAGYNWTFITNSTGVSGIAIRTTGTTWKYVNVTSVLPT